MFQVQCYSEGDWYAVRVPRMLSEQWTLEQARFAFRDAFPDSVKTRAVSNYRILDLITHHVYPVLPDRAYQQTPDRRSGTYDRRDAIVSRVHLPRPERRKDPVLRAKVQEVTKRRIEE